MRDTDPYALNDKYGESGITCFRVRCRNIETNQVSAWTDKGDCTTAGNSLGDPAYIGGEFARNR